MGDGWEAYYNEPLVRSASTTEAGNDNDSTAVGGTTQGTVEGPPTLTAATEGTARQRPVHAEPEDVRQPRTLRSRASDSAMATLRTAATSALTRTVRAYGALLRCQSLSRMCLAALKRSRCSTTPHRRKCVFDAGQDTLNLVGAQEWTLARSGARVGGLGGGGVGVLPATVLHPCQDLHHCHRTSITTGLWRWCGEARNR